MKAKALRDDMKGEHYSEEEVEALRDELTTKTTMLNRMHGDLERSEKTVDHLQKELLAKTSHTNEVGYTSVSPFPLLPSLRLPLNK